MNYFLQHIDEVIIDSYDSGDKLPPGIYFYRFTTPIGEVFQGKWVK